MKGLVYDGTKAAIRDDVEVRPPGPTEVKVRVVSAGLCHSDLSVIDGTIPWPTPAVLGHEGAGIVAEVGEAVGCPQERRERDRDRHAEVRLGPLDLGRGAARP